MYSGNPDHLLRLVPDDELVTHVSIYLECSFIQSILNLGLDI